MMFASLGFRVLWSTFSIMSNPFVGLELSSIIATLICVAPGDAGVKTGGSAGHEAKPTGATQTTPTRAACAGLIAGMDATKDDRTIRRSTARGRILFNRLCASFRF
jgi:hypothetical protein